MDVDVPTEPASPGSASRRVRLAEAWSRHPPVRAGAWIALGLAILALTWPVPAATISPGLDSSWQIGLHVAAGLHLRSGVDLVFTYGPLGYLVSPNPYLGGTSLLALVADSAVYLGLIAVLLASTRRILPIWAAALVVVLIGRTFAFLPTFEALQALTLLACAEALATRHDWRPAIVCVALGLAAGVTVLGKINVGVFVVGMTVVTSMTLDRRWWRGLAIAAVTGLATALVLWLATGQRIGDLGAYVAGSIQIVNGYSESMGLDIDPGLLWIYLAFVGILVLAGWTAWRASATWPRRGRIGFLIICAVIAFAEWKTAVTRTAAPMVFATFLVFVVAVGTSIGDRRLWLMPVLVAGMAFLGTARLSPGAFANVVGSVRSLGVEVATEIIPGRAERVVERNRAILRSRYALDSITLRELAGRRVAIDPAESGVAFAYPEIVWDPLPVFQSYSAYTPELDALNAARLASAQAPDRILRQVTLLTDPPDWLTRQRGRPLKQGETVPLVVDGRFRWFEAPAAMLETFCRYRELSSVRNWQVLGRSADSCGPPEPLQTVRAAEGRTVTVPVESRPGRFVIVRVRGLEPSILDRIRTTLFKAEEWYVTIEGVRYRLVAPTAADGLLLAVPPGADGTGVNAFGPPITSLSIASRDPGPRRTLTYEFLSVPLVRP
jgi:hypothetical protein